MAGKNQISVPYSPDAQRYLKEIEKRREAVFSTVSRLPIAVLLWGPSPDSDSLAAQTRIKLRDELIRNGHVAEFSEDLIEEDGNRSLQVQQIAHLEAADIAFSIAESIGSMAEIHDFAKLPHVAHKIVTFLNSNYNDGYGNRSLMELQTQLTTRIELYDPSLMPDCIVKRALEIVHRLQELHYLMGRRV